MVGLNAAVAACTASENAQKAVHVLALNCGSSSLKFACYSLRSTRVSLLLYGEFVDARVADSDLQSADNDSHSDRSTKLPIGEPVAMLAHVAALLAEAGIAPLNAVVHRFVHGGAVLRQHCVIDLACLEQLEAAAAFAPLHMPFALTILRAASAQFSGLAQIACFDTAFHTGLPDVARILPLPKALLAAGIQRYGFHGLSCESIVRQLTNGVPHRLIVAHLGHGASVTAIKDGCSVDTSMGLTPTGGVIMGTRSGDLDPGVLLYLMRELHYDADMLAALVDKQAGLLGISGRSGDLRELHAHAPFDADACLAVRMFCYSVLKQVAGMMAALGGLDVLVFTGGIGENDARVRAAVCAGLAWSGIHLDPVSNRTATNPLTDPASRPLVLVLPSRETEQMARHARDLLR